MSKHYYGIDDFLNTHGDTGRRTLVVGSKVYGSEVDRRALYPNSIGVDMQEGEGVDFVHNMNAPLPEALGKFDHIDLVSVLEHCDKPWLVCENIARAVNPEASILVSTPFAWRVHGYPSDYWRITIRAYEVLFPNVQWVERGYLSGSLFKKISPAKTLSNKVFLQRSEAIGYGLFVF